MPMASLSNVPFQFLKYRWRSDRRSAICARRVSPRRIAARSSSTRAQRTSEGKSSARRFQRSAPSVAGVSGVASHSRWIAVTVSGASELRTSIDSDRRSAVSRRRSSLMLIQPGPHEGSLGKLSANPSSSAATPNPRQSRSPCLYSHPRARSATSGATSTKSGALLVTLRKYAFHSSSTSGSFRHFTIRYPGNSSCEPNSS